MTSIRNPLIDGMKALWGNLRHTLKFNRGATWGMMILGALLAFEIFNFSTTQFALHDILGDLTFAGMRWATILAVAFCGIDFAGIARIFTPEQGRDEPAEVYYLFGAWLLAAGFNASLTWWGVSVAISNNSNLPSSAVVSAETMTKIVPVFIAAMVWLIRLLIIGTFSLAGDRLFTTSAQNQSQQRPYPSQGNYANQRAATAQAASSNASLRPASQLNRPSTTTSGYRPAPKPAQTSFSPQEPTYHPVSYNARASENSGHYDA